MAEKTTTTTDFIHFIIDKMDKKICGIENFQFKIQQK